MQEHQKFSLKTVLTSRQIKPEVYKQIIHEIKSPIQQQSFQLTNDESNSSNTFQKMSKRPNIPLVSSQGPHIHFQNNQFIQTYQSFSEDVKLNQSKNEKDANDNVVIFFLSPLQYEVNSKQQSQKFFCGASNSKKKIDDQTQVLLPTKSRRGIRKPIFQKKQQSKPLKTLDQVLNKLKAINQNQLVLFLQFMGELQKILGKLLNDKNAMQTNISYVFQRLALETQHSPFTIQSNQAYSKILQRFKSKNSGQVIKRLFRRDQKNQKVGQALLQKLFKELSNLQTTIFQFITKQQSIQKLQSAFDFIDQNFQKQTSFKAQLCKFYQNLSINISTNGLQLIWNNCEERNLSKLEFLQGLSLNNFLVRQKQGFEEVLVERGFLRNEF